MKLLAMILFLMALLSGCSTTHSWMEQAMVGTVDGQQVVVTCSPLINTPRC